MYQTLCIIQLLHHAASQRSVNYCLVSHLFCQVKLELAGTVRLQVPSWWVHGINGSTMRFVKCAQNSMWVLYGIVYWLFLHMHGCVEGLCCPCICGIVMICCTCKGCVEGLDSPCLSPDWGWEKPHNPLLLHHHARIQLVCMHVWSTCKKINN